MLEYITPIVFFCAVVSGEPNICDGKTAIERHVLDATGTPIDCLLKGTTDATSYISSFETEHPNKKLQYRVICKSSLQKT